jgi:hypothetical protein
MADSVMQLMLSQTDLVTSGMLPPAGGYQMDALAD